jgi:ribonucleoside-triphosphate reductase
MRHGLFQTSKAYNNNNGEAMKDIDTRALMGEAKFYEAYSRWDDSLGRYETWEESVTRVMNMHREFYRDKMTPELDLLIDEAEHLYKLKYVLGAQRALQFGGDQILKHHMRMFNCTSSYADRPAFFGELFYVLLCGAGAGFSVQKHHIDRLPNVTQRKGQAKIHVVEDSIEGWATALDALMSSFFSDGGKHPEYAGRRVYFDLNKVRPKGAHISGGFKAPGPEPLRRALDKIEHLIQGVVLSGRTRLRPIEVYDVCMHAADAVLAGGVRRSATICLFSPDDEEMINAKTGNWFSENPQRGRSNNSAVIVRKDANREQFARIMKSIRQFGEPGFVFTESTEHTYNPCVEIGKYPVWIDPDSGEHISGWQGCNLTEGNGAKCTTVEEFRKVCRASAILGTLQAGYTDFKFLDDVSKKIFDREALIGVSLTGWMNSPEVLFNDEVLQEGAELVKAVNRQVAELIGINPAARTTCVKPSGNASVLLGTSSGIHGDHAPRYIRHMQMNKEQEVAQLIKENNPYMVEESVWSTNGTDYQIAFPVIAPENSVFKRELYGVELLRRVKQVQNNWVEYGTDESLCVDPTVRHNVSNTVQVAPDQWDEVEEFLFKNRGSFAGISFIPATGDKDYNQAPFTEVLTEQQLVDRYGRAAVFASGLIVESFKGFGDLWTATFVAQQPEEERPVGEAGDQSADWIRRFDRFADNYFDGDKKAAEYCLKDVHLLHKWTKIQQNMSYIDFKNGLAQKKYTDIDQTGASSCYAGACEI